MLRFVVGAVHIKMSGHRDASESLNQVDSVLVEQKTDPFRHRFGHVARTGDDFFQIGLHFARKFQSVMSGGRAIVVDLRTFQQCFRRDAAPIEAYAPGFRPLDERDLFA